MTDESSLISDGPIFKAQDALRHFQKALSIFHKDFSTTTMTSFGHQTHLPLTALLECRQHARLIYSLCKEYKALLINAKQEYDQIALQTMSLEHELHHLQEQLDKYNQMPYKYRDTLKSIVAEHEGKIEEVHVESLLQKELEDRQAALLARATLDNELQTIQAELMKRHDHLNALEKQLKAMLGSREALDLLEMIDVMEKATQNVSSQKLALEVDLGTIVESIKIIFAPCCFAEDTAVTMMDIESEIGQKHQHNERLHDHKMEGETIFDKSITLLLDDCPWVNIKVVPIESIGSSLVGIKLKFASELMVSNPVMWYLQLPIDNAYILTIPIEHNDFSEGESILVLRWLNVLTGTIKEDIKSFSVEKAREVVQIMKQAVISRAKIIEKLRKEEEEKTNKETEIASFHVDSQDPNLFDLVHVDGSMKRFKLKNDQLDEIK